MLKKYCCFIVLIIILLPFNAWSEDSLQTEKSNLGNIDVRCEVSESAKDYLPTVIGIAKSAYDFYSNIYGESSFSSINISETTEIPGARTITNDISLNAKYLPERGEAATFESLAYVLPHEVSHLWWGGQRNIHEGWLIEGTATFSSELFLVHLYGEDSIYRKNRRFNYYYDKPYVLKPAYKVPIINLDQDFTKETTALLYDKGCLIFDMLRQTLGDNDFFCVMKKFNSSKKELNTKRLEAIVNSVTGQNYDWFFTQWVYKAGYPRLAYNYKVIDEKGKKVLKLYVEQKSNVFRLKLPIMIKTDSNVQNSMLDLAERRHIWSFEVQGDVQCIIFDPAFRNFVYIEGSALDFALKAKDAFAKGKFADAERLYEEVLRQEPNLWNMQLKLAEVYEKEGKRDNALKIYKDLFDFFASETKSKPENFANYIMLGNIAKRQMNYDLAKLEYEKAITINPSSLDAYFELGNILSLTGDYDNAIKHFTTILNYWPNNYLSARVRRAEAYMKLGEISGAQNDCEYLENQIAEYGSQISEARIAQIYLITAKIYDLQGKRKDAIEKYKEILDLDADQEDIKTAKEGLKKPFK